MASKKYDGLSVATVSVPVGIEKVLFLAASDSEFKAKLLAHRGETLRDERLKLDDAERELLRAVPVEQLQTMIDRIEPKAHGKRQFMRSVAACTATLVSTTLLRCAPAGIDPGSKWDARAPDAHEPSTVDAEVPMGWDAGRVKPDESDADMPSGEDSGST